MSERPDPKQFDQPDQPEQPGPADQQITQLEVRTFEGEVEDPFQRVTIRPINRTIGIGTNP